MSFDVALQAQSSLAGLRAPGCAAIETKKMVKASTLGHASVKALLVWATVVCVTAASDVATGGPMYIGGTLSGTVYDIDSEAGVASNPRNTGLEVLSGLARTTSGAMYAVGNLPGESVSLFSLDPITASAVVVGAGIGIEGASGLAFDPFSQDLFAFTNPTGGGSADIVRIDQSTGAGEVFDGAPAALSAIEFDSVGLLFGLTSDSILTPSAEVSLSSSVGLLSGLAPAAANLLYLTNDFSGVDLLYVLNPQTGVLVPIGPTGVADGITSLTVPEPGSLLVLSLGVAGMVLRRRRTQRP